jgi:hypothetical protein
MDRDQLTNHANPLANCANWISLRALDAEQLGFTMELDELGHKWVVRSILPSKNEPNIALRPWPQDDVQSVRLIVTRYRCAFAGIASHWFTRQLPAVWETRPAMRRGLGSAPMILGEL